MILNGGLVIFACVFTHAKYRAALPWLLIFDKLFSSEVKITDHSEHIIDAN